MKNSDKKITVVPALEKALDIMEYIAQQGTAVTLKEISLNLGIPPATAYRTVKYLCSRRYLQEDIQTEGEYLLGPQLLYLAHLITKQFDLIHQAKPAMKELAAQCGQTTQLGILQDFGVMYIEQTLPSKPVNIIAALRTVIPVNVSASGKVLVAHLSPQEREQFLQNAALPSQTENTIVDITAFKQELALVRERGYALDNEEYARGIGCAAAPIRDHRGQVIAAIGITGHIGDYVNEEKRKQLVEHVISAAQSISEGMAGTQNDKRSTH